MNEFCRGCEDRRTPGCVLPSTSERFGAAVRYTVLLTLEGLAALGTAHSYVQAQGGQPTNAFLENAQEAWAAQEAPVEACIILHQSQQAE